MDKDVHIRAVDAPKRSSRASSRGQDKGYFQRKAADGASICGLLVQTVSMCSEIPLERQTGSSSTDAASSAPVAAASKRRYDCGGRAIARGSAEEVSDAHARRSSSALES